VDASLDDLEDVVARLHDIDDTTTLQRLIAINDRLTARICAAKRRGKLRLASSIREGKIRHFMAYLAASSNQAVPSHQSPLTWSFDLISNMRWN